MSPNFAVKILRSTQYFETLKKREITIKQFFVSVFSKEPFRDEINLPCRAVIDTKIAFHVQALEHLYNPP